MTDCATGQPLDILEGDFLVVNSREYPIRSCAEWEWGYGRAMRRFTTVTASTKRSPAISGGKRGNPVAKLLGLKCTPLDPVDPEIRQRLALNTPHELLETFVDGGGVFLHLILEELKR
jgi:hypothetical protein